MGECLAVSLDRRGWYRIVWGDSGMVASISGFGGYKARIVPEGKRQPSLMESNATEFEKAVWRIARGS